MIIDFSDRATLQRGVASPSSVHGREWCLASLKHV